VHIVVKGGGPEVLHGLRVEYSPSLEANSSSYSREISAVLCNPIFHYRVRVFCRVHYRPPFVLILSQANSVHAKPFKDFEVNFNTKTDKIIVLLNVMFIFLESKSEGVVTVSGVCS
jgi:hypothetical protein